MLVTDMFVTDHPKVTFKDTSSAEFHLMSCVFTTPLSKWWCGERRYRLCQSCHSHLKQFSAIFRCSCFHYVPRTPYTINDQACAILYLNMTENACYVCWACLTETLTKDYCNKSTHNISSERVLENIREEKMLNKNTLQTMK